MGDNAIHIDPHQPGEVARDQGIEYVLGQQHGADDGPRLPQDPVAHNWGNDCLAIVRDYREGRKDRTEVIRELVQAVDAIRDQLQGNGGRDGNATLGAFFGMLDEVDRETAAAAQAGGRAPQDPGPGEVQQERQDPLRRPGIRGRDEDAEGDRACKRRAIDNRMQFHVGVDPTLPPDLRETLEAVQDFGNDPTYARTRILNSADRPDFPASLWADVVSNAFVDLDKILDFHYATSGDRKRATHQLGDLQLVSDSGKIDRHVRTCGEWTIAWAKYKAAVLFVFPHRGRELDSYGTHIEDVFLANLNAADRVIRYDKRVRTRAAESPRLRLSDTPAFFTDYQYFILGSGGSSSSGGQRTASAK
jgi:hypothetical protein